MGKRKVLNKCDPAKIPRQTQPENLQLGGIMILPMNVRCLRCGNHMWRGTQLDARKEDVIGEKYLEIQVCRIHFKCKNCSSKITFKTDPQNADFIVESGASRDCRPWPNADEARDLLLKYEQEMPVRAPLKKIRSTNMEGLFMLPMRIRCLAC
ncbi:hypothetical protein LUZ60_005240 [Juncus effusus]|nr:hypothetical protein LUZ60_005240 [Juncus effusus]